MDTPFIFGVAEAKGLDWGVIEAAPKTPEKGLLVVLGGFEGAPNGLLVVDEG